MVQENSIVLIYIQSTPKFYARIEKIDPDIKPGWYHVNIKPLYILPNNNPAENFSWLIRDVYIQGEPFTIDGTEVQIIESPPPIETLKRNNDNTEDDAEEKDEEKPEEIQASNELIREFNELKKQSVVDFEKFKELRKEIFTPTPNYTA